MSPKVHGNQRTHPYSNNVLASKLYYSVEKHLGKIKFYECHFIKPSIQNVLQTIKCEVENPM